MSQRKVLRLTIFFLICFLASWPSVAQMQQGRQVVFDGLPDSTQFPLVQTRVAVTNGHGVPFADLKAGQFTVTEDGKQVAVDKVKPVVNPDVQIAVALVIDISGSMAGKPLDDAKAAANAFLDKLALQDQGAIIAFRSHVNLDEPFPQIDDTREVDFTPDHGRLHNLVNSLTATLGQGKTCLYDAAFKAVKMTALHTAGRRAVLVFTDGRETPAESCSVMKADDPVNEARSSGVPVFTVGLGKDVDPAYLRRLALTTGGIYQQTEYSAQLTTLFQKVADQLKQQYIVTYHSSAPADGAKHVLRIVVSLPGGEASGQSTFVAALPATPGVRIPLSDGQEITGTLSVTPEIFHRDPLQKVEFYVDDQLASTATKSPYTFFWDVSALPNGDHKLAVKAYDATGDIGEAEVTVKIALSLGGGTVVQSGKGAGQQGGGGAIDNQKSTSGTSIPWPLVAGVAAILILLVGAGLVVYYRRSRVAQSPPPTFSGGPPTIPGQPLDGVEGPGATPPPWGPTPGTQPSGPGTVPIAAGVPGVPAGQPPDPGTKVLKAPVKALAYFIMEKGTHQGHAFPLTEGDTTIGREGSNNIALDDLTASRQHAKVRFLEGEFFIHDMAATNPTQVNGKEVVRQQLSDGDHVQIGETQFVFKKV